MSRSNSSVVSFVDVARESSSGSRSHGRSVECIGGESCPENCGAEGFETWEEFEFGEVARESSNGSRSHGRSVIRIGGESCPENCGAKGFEPWEEFEFGKIEEVAEDEKLGSLLGETPTPQAPGSSQPRTVSDSCHSGYDGDTGSSDSSSEEVITICRCCYEEQATDRILTALQGRKIDNVCSKRMVLEPKFADYGSIQSIGEMVVGHQSHQTDSSGSLVPTGTLKALTAAEQEVAVVNMTQGDLYQRQPLLSAPAKGDKWGHGNHPTPAKEYYVEDDEENILEKSHQESNGIIKINIPTPVREEPRFPQERWKTLISLVIFFFSSVLVLISLATVHERVPDRKTYGPLPDIFYEILGAHDWGLTVSEYLIIFSFNSTGVFIFLHKHRFILARRLFLIMSLLYMYRAFTMFVTVLPISSTTYYCSPQNNNTSTLEMTKRVLQMLSGMGLSINGKQTYCGDFIYSGHTLILVLSYLFIAEYTPKKLYLVHWLYWLSAAVGIFMLELSRSHYTIDVILAYYITTRLFWIYHTLANNQSLKQHSERNLLGRSWWFNFFLYFEGNVGGQVPRQWPDWPFPWPRRFQTKSRDS